MDARTQEANGIHESRTYQSALTDLTNALHAFDKAEEGTPSYEAFQASFFAAITALEAAIDAHTARLIAVAMAAPKA